MRATATQGSKPTGRISDETSQDAQSEARRSQTSERPDGRRGAAPVTHGHPHLEQTCAASGPVQFTKMLAELETKIWRNRLNMVE